MGVAVALFAFGGCASGQQEDRPVTETPSDGVRHNILTEAERDAGWELLFDGRTVDGWRGYHRDGPPQGWAVVDGALSRVGTGGDIITERQFADFI